MRDVLENRLGFAFVLQNYDGLRHFARFFIRIRNYRRVRNARMCQQYRFELGGRDLKTFVLDQFLSAIDDVEMTIFVA